MKKLLMTAGDYVFEREDSPRGGYIGGKIIATNIKTGEVISKIYKVNHDKKSNYWQVFAELVTQLAPLPKEEEKDEKENDEGRNEVSVSKDSTTD